VLHETKERSRRVKILFLRLVLVVVDDAVVDVVVVVVRSYA